MRQQDGLRRIGAKDRRRRKRSVLRTHGRKCWLCGVEISDDKEVSLDHVIPVSLGGSNVVTNLRPAHRGCNSRRGNEIVLDGYPPEEVISDAPMQ